MALEKGSISISTGGFPVESRIDVNQILIYEWSFKCELPNFIQHNVGVPRLSNQSRKRNRRMLNWKGRSKTITVDDMILYMEDPKDTTRKLLEHFSVFG